MPAVSCLQEASEDVRTLARLWQLQAKMNTVDSGQGSAYEARIERVSAVAAGIEERLAKRLELLDGYARVMNMIEIEVEMDTQVSRVVVVVHAAQVACLGWNSSQVSLHCGFHRSMHIWASRNLMQLPRAGLHQQTREPAVLLLQSATGCCVYGCRSLLLSWMDLVWSWRNCRSWRQSRRSGNSRQRHRMR